jgi:carotenoid cleavage dioxygenase
VAPYLQCYTIEPDGRCSLAETIDAPYPAMMHDFAITENYVIFSALPRHDGFRGAVEAGWPASRDALKWQPELGMKFGVKRREKGAPVQWLDVPSTGYIFHPGNAYEEDGKIVLDACTYLDPPALLASLNTWRSGTLRPGYAAVPCLSTRSTLPRAALPTAVWMIAAASSRALDDRLVGYRNRYGYAVRAGADDFSSVVR